MLVYSTRKKLKKGYYTKKVEQPLYIQKKRCQYVQMALFNYETD